MQIINVTESETFIIFKKIMLGDLIYMSPYNLVRKKHKIL